jgi:hypothetical protein
MDQYRILELALESLEKQKAGIEAEIEAIQADLRGKGAAGFGRGRRRTASERKSHSEAMRAYWAAKKSNAAKVTSAPKRKAKTAAEKKAISLKMKEAWKKRKAAAAKKSK